ncbi:MAG: response regulator transcription factor [Lachnospiraceae bacterium]|jgi:two-component system response regulator YesN
MYRTVIIDDEKWVIKSLIASLGHPDDIEIIGECSDGISGMRFLRDEKPDLAFVDVRLPGMTGLEILEAARREGLPTLFIVISAYAEFSYAQSAMLNSAIGYCLKPFSRRELTETLNKARSLLAKRDAAGNQKKAAPSPAVPVPEAAVRNRAVARMIDYINSHYMEDISIQTLADLCSINANYAGQLFRQKTGHTFSSYLTSVRVEHAVPLLRDTDMPISLVAASVGYQDYFYFAKVFKKATGVTPSSYRKDTDLPPEENPEDEKDDL